MSTTKDEPCAYAKLWGKLDDNQKEFSAYIKTLPTTLGRPSAATNGDRKPDDFIGLGDSRYLSKKHAIIRWVPSEKTYKIECLCRNGMTVGGKYVGEKGVAPLRSRTPIKLGPSRVYFLLPEGGAGSGSEKGSGTAGPVPGTVSSMANANTSAKQTTPQVPKGKSPKSSVQPGPRGDVSFAEMVRGAFKDAELKKIAAQGGLSSGDVQNWVMQNYPSWNVEGLKMRNLAFGIEEALKENFRLNGTDRWVEQAAGDEPAAKRTKISTGSEAPSSTTSSASGIGTATATATKTVLLPAKSAPAVLTPAVPTPSTTPNMVTKITPDVPSLSTSSTSTVGTNASAAEPSPIVVNDAGAAAGGYARNDAGLDGGSVVDVGGDVDVGIDVSAT